MRIAARVQNRRGEHSVLVSTEGREKPLPISAKSEGIGSSVNGGELLFLALATCYCNDLYREAGKRGIEVTGVDVEVSGEFGGPGEPAHNVRYRATVHSDAPQEDVLVPMRHTDTVAEIQNTIRSGCPVMLSECEVKSASSAGTA